MIKLLGRGASSIVQLRQDPTTDACFAVKVINVFDKAKRHQVMEEIDQLYDADCDALVDFYGCNFTDGKISVALEYMDLGSLDNVYGKCVCCMLRAACLECPSRAARCIAERAAYYRPISAPDHASDRSRLAPLGTPPQGLHQSSRSVLLCGLLVEPLPPPLPPHPCSTTHPSILTKPTRLYTHLIINSVPHTEHLQLHLIWSDLNPAIGHALAHARHLGRCGSDVGPMRHVLFHLI